MKIDLTTSFTNENGQNIKDGEQDLTIGKVITTAILSPMKDDDKLTGEEKANLFNLWFDKIRNKKTADLEPEEIILIKERVGKAYAQIIVGQSFKILKGK